MVQLKENKEFKAAQSLGREISSTLKSSPELWSAYGKSYCTLDLSVAASIVEELVADMDGVEKMREAVDTLETLPGSDCMKLAFEVKKEKEESDDEKVVVADQAEDKERDDLLEQLTAMEASVKKLQKKIAEILSDSRKG